MTHRHRRGCGPRGRDFSFPEALFAMAAGRGWGGGFDPFHFDFDEPPTPPSPPRPPGAPGFRGRRGRMFESGQLRLVLLKLVADEPRHGYDLIRAIEELTGGGYVPSAGVVYPTLTLLQDMGLIEEAPGEGARKPFQATDEGRTHLEENEQEVEQLFDRLEQAGSRRRRSHRPEIGRALGNLMAALKNRVAHEGWNEDLLNEVIDILDDAAQRIERAKPTSE